MKKLKKQIKESFFNPVFHLFPLLLFLVVDDFFGMNTAWKITFPVAVALVLYVYYIYNRIFAWHAVFTGLFVAISLITGSELLFTMPPQIKSHVFEVVTFVFFFLFVVFRVPLKSLISKYMSKLVPMTNNFDEMYKFILGIALILSFYISIHLYLGYRPDENSFAYQRVLQYFYVGLLVFFSVYEIFRVQYVRSRLLHEEWWPIVSDQGKIIGTIEHRTSLFDDNKYMHPVVRVLLVDKGRVLLQKRTENNVIHPGLWDTAISNHVKVGETIEQCVDRTAKERYMLDKFKYMHLSNYTLEVKNEFHYTFLFISCQLLEIKPNPAFIDQTKWWTQHQIEDNLEAGIFSENFKIEYDLLKRSGLLDTGKCDCNCHLKEVIYSQANAML